MERWEGKVVVITGASSGIGQALVKKLVCYGLKVVALARRTERLQILEDECKPKGGNKGLVKGIKCDVSKEEDIKAAFDWIEQNWGAINILINNAGVLQQNLLTDLDLEKVCQTLNTNVIGSISALKYALASMHKHNVHDGHLIIVNSVAGHDVLPIPGISSYCASKNALRVYTECLRNELSLMKSKIRVTSICPGLVETEMTEQFKEHFISDTPILKTNDIVDCIVYALSAPNHVTIADLSIRPTGESVALSAAVLLKQ